MDNECGGDIMSNKVSNLWDFCETLHSNLMEDYNKVSSIYNNARKYTEYIAKLMKKLRVVNNDRPSEYYPEWFKIDHTWWETNKLEKTNNDLLKKVAQTYRHWRYEIANGFDKKSRRMKYTNAIAEGLNNQLKTILKNAYGYHNFERFRKRAMLIMTYKHKGI